MPIRILVLAGRGVTCTRLWDASTARSCVSKHARRRLAPESPGPDALRMPPGLADAVLYLQYDQGGMRRPMSLKPQMETDEAMSSIDGESTLWNLTGFSPNTSS